MNTRIKTLRTFVGKSQAAFGKELNVSLSAVQKWESGENVPSKQTIELMSRIYDVNSDWVLTGQGSMLRDLDESEKILKYVSDITKSENADVQRFVLNFMANLPKPLWAELEKYGRELLNKKGD